MKLSTKTRYGLRALVDLASYGENEQVALAKLSSRQELSVSYMEQVFVTLRKADIIKSTKGAQGGYSLARSSEEITVGQIIRALEGQILIVEESKNKGDESLIAHNMEQCLQNQVWTPINESVNKVIDNITLAQLAQDMVKITEACIDMYYI